MAESWDARAWVAEVVGCDPADLSILGTDESSGRQVWYAGGDGTQVARLVVAGPIRPLGGEDHWAVAVQLPDGTIHDGPEVPESTHIAY
jgi:hypothetical protein